MSALRKPAADLPPEAPEAVEARLKAREHLLALMSHEIRTPLNGVLGMTGLLAQTQLDATQRAYLGALRESGEHLLALVNDILDYAKLGAGEIELEPTTLDVERLLQGVCELLSPRAYEKGLEIAWACDADLPVISADDGRLRQVLFNLAGNAVKFTEEGGVLITAELRGRAAASARVRFCVQDTGPGVPAGAEARIFEEFQHARAGDGIRHGGAGLGLAIVRRLAEAMGGRTGLEPASEAGAVFWFEAEFPVARELAEAAVLAGRTVAVVSPSAVVREGAARQIVASGGRAVVAETLEQAEARIGPGTPVLIDHAVRGAGGPPEPAQGRPAIVLLAPEERGRIGRYRRQGWAGYLIKPLRRASLATRVLAAVGAPAPAVRSPADDERAAPSAVAGARVLLAEDNAINALLATAVLTREGCVVDRVGTGAEALEALARGAYDLVLMDVRMPDMDGREATRVYRARGGTAPVIALTAHAFEEDRKVCLEAGMDDFLVKPLDFEALKAALGRWTSGKAPAADGRS